jgi:hypothetical protein
MMAPGDARRIRQRQAPPLARTDPARDRTDPIPREATPSLIEPARSRKKLPFLGARVSDPAPSIPGPREPTAFPIESTSPGLRSPLSEQSTPLEGEKTSSRRRILVSKRTKAVRSRRCSFLPRTTLLDRKRPSFPSKRATSRTGTNAFDSRTTPLRRRRPFASRTDLFLREPASFFAVLLSFPPDPPTFRR